MGIDTLYNEIQKYKIKYIWKDLGLQANYLHIDMNYLLHTICLKKTNKDITEDDIIKKTAELIKSLYNIYKPDKGVYLCSDGSASMAKYRLQRYRRFVSENNNNIALLFTPGTKFMLDLEDRVYKAIEEPLRSSIIFLDKYHEEAEIKIKKKIDDLIIEEPNSVHIVFNNDGDMISLLNMISNNSNIFIITSSPNYSYAIRVSKIIEEHFNKFGYPNKYVNQTFAVMCIFMGNDYLPKIATLNFTKLWESWKTINEVLTEDLIDNITNGEIIINNKFLRMMICNIISNTTFNWNIKFLHCNTTKGIENYVHGFNWCIDMYYNGVTTNNHYYCEERIQGVSAINLLNFLSGKDFNDYKQRIKTPPFDFFYYGALIMPKTKKNLLYGNLNKFIDKYDTFLYPDCITCQQKNLSKHDMEIHCVSHDIYKIDKIIEHYEYFKEIHNN